MKCSNLLLAIGLICMSLPLYAQKVVKREKKDEYTTVLAYDNGAKETYHYIEQMPQAEYDINAFLAKNMQYPTDAKNQGIDGKVIACFIVRSTGRLDSAFIRRGIYPSLDAEVLRIIKLMPPWKPGMREGKAVDVMFTMPFRFCAE